MPLGEGPPYKNAACNEDNHNMQRDYNGYRKCANCGLSGQTIVDDLGHDLELGGKP